MVASPSPRIATPRRHLCDKFDCPCECHVYPDPGPRSGRGPRSIGQIFEDLIGRPVKTQQDVRNLVAALRVDFDGQCAG